MNHQITTTQLRYSVAAFIIASALLTKTLYTYTKNQSWIPIVLAAAVSYFIISIYCRLVRDHPGFSLIEINDAVFGPVIGRILSALYVFFFLTLTLFNTNDLGEFVKSIILPGTPIVIIYLVFLLVCSYTVRKGAHYMTSFSVLITVINIAAVIFNGLLLVKEIHFENFLPVLNLPVKNYLLSTHLVTMLPFCEILVFLMFVQDMKNPNDVGKALKGGFFIAALTILVIVMRDIAVLGDYTLFTATPTFAAIRLIDVGEILTRLDIVYATILIIMFFFKISILLYATVTGASKLFNIKDYKSLIAIITALVVIYANFIFLSTDAHTKWFNAAATYATFFLFILPAVTLIVSKIRKPVSTGKPDTSGMQI